MSVTDFECAIAKSQIGRYIAGDNLAPEIARQLESHINNCSRCKELLQEKKNSLEAMIDDDMEMINVASDAIPMTNGSSALKPDYMEVLADSARKSLREKLKDSTRIKAETIEVPTVASAFAYKDAIETETVQLTIEAPEEPVKRKAGLLTAFALYKNVPDEANRPTLSKDNIRAAKAVIRDTDPSMKKPMMYLAGLCAVVAAMSFVLRDPTTLFGGRVQAIAKSKPSNKVVAPTKRATGTVAKVLPHKTTKLKDKGIDAQGFTKKEPAKKLKLTPKPKSGSAPTKSTKVTKGGKASATKSPKVATPKLARRSISNLSISKTQAQNFIDSTKKAKKSKPVTVKKPRKPTIEDNSVKLYTPETTPQSQEQK
jgi:hypothetical protein